MALRNEYLEADEATKRFLEQRYGKRVIQKALEEIESKEWLEKNSKACPCCGTHIEVSMEGRGGGVVVTLHTNSDEVSCVLRLGQRWVCRIQGHQGGQTDRKW